MATNDEGAATAATAVAADQLVVDAVTCPVCTDVFIAPVTLDCGHSFCWGCIGEWKDAAQPGSDQCPACRSARPRKVDTLSITVALDRVAQSVATTVGTDASLVVSRLRRHLWTKRDGGARVLALVAQLDAAALESPGAKNRTLLYLACRSGLSDVALALIERGANVNAKNTCGFTCLQLAAERGSLPLVKALLAGGAASREFTIAPLMMAVDARRPDVLRELLEAGVGMVDPKCTAHLLRTKLMPLLSTGVQVQASMAVLRAAVLAKRADLVLSLVETGALTGDTGNDSQWMAEKVTPLLVQGAMARGKEAISSAVGAAMECRPTTASAPSSMV